MGKGNSKVIESTACAVYNPSKFLQANNNNRSTTYLSVDLIKQNMGIEQSQDPLFDSDEDLLYIAENDVIPNPKPTAQQVRAKRRRTVVDPDPLNEEPGVYEESQDDQVARYFNSPQGKMGLVKYGKVQARKKAKIMDAIMH